MRGIKAAGRRAAFHRAPDARLVLYDRGGHLWVGRQAEVWREVTDFLHGLPPN